MANNWAELPRQYKSIFNQHLMNTENLKYMKVISALLYFYKPNILEEEKLNSASKGSLHFLITNWEVKYVMPITAAFCVNNWWSSTRSNLT
jgi:hypothetical protein